MKNIFLALIGGAAVLGVIVMIVLAGRLPYRVSATLVPVASSATTHTLSHNVVYFFDLFAQDLAGTHARADVSATREGKSDVIRVTAYGETASVAAETLRDARAAVERDVRAVYGADVALTVVRADHTVQRRSSVALAPYGIMIALAAMALSAVGWFFDMRSASRIMRTTATVPSWEARRVFASVHAPSPQDMAVQTVTTMQTDARQQSRNAHLHKKTDTVARDKKDATMTVPQQPTRTQKEEAAPIVPPAPAVMPSGLQTTPGNLPVVDVAALGLVTVDPSAQQEVAVEPTEAELKARLNALLGGTLS